MPLRPTETNFVFWVSKLGRLAKQVCIQTAAKPLVRAEHNDQFALHVTFFQQRVQILIDTVAQRDEDAI